MNPFNNCPRCKKKYLLTQMNCSKCGLYISNNMYRFETEKYIISIYEESNKTFIRSKKTTPIWNTFDFLVPETQITINKKLPPETTEQDIEKYIILK